MKRLLFCLSISGFIFIQPAHIFSQDLNLYVPDKIIPLEGAGWYDYLSIDSVNYRLYVSHETTVNVIDLNTQKPIGEIHGLQYSHCIAIANDLNKGFISDGMGKSVAVFDLKTLSTMKTIYLKDKGSPDAIVYDKYSKKVFAFTGGIRYISVIDAQSLDEIDTISMSEAPEFSVVDGKGKLYNNLANGSLNVIDTKSLKLLDNFSLFPCGKPTGIAIDEKNNRLFTVCQKNNGMSVVDINSGEVISTISIGAGADGVVYDPSTRLVFSSNGGGDGSVTIIKQESANNYHVIQTLKTYPHAKTMAIDQITHKIYLSAPDFEPGTNKIIPGSLKVFIYKMNSMK